MTSTTTARSLSLSLALSLSLSFGVKELTIELHPLSLAMALRRHERNAVTAKTKSVARVTLH